MLTTNGRIEAILLLITAVFVFLNATALSLVEQAGTPAAHLWAPAAWLLLMAAAWLLLNRFTPTHDPLLLPVFALLSGWGVLLIDRLAPNFLLRQTLWLALGTAVMLAIAILPRNLRYLRQYRYTWLFTGLLLLAATLVFGVSPTGQGVALWLPLPVPFVGPIFFQPSELLKLLLVVFLASYFAEQRPFWLPAVGGGWRARLAFLAPLLLMWGFCMVLLVWQRDLGAATIFFIVFVAVLYLAAGDRRYVVAGLGLLLLAGLFAYFVFDVVALRVDAWINPWPEARADAYQIVQALYALAAGGVIGQGIGQGFPDYIPVVHSDFAFAAVAEEWGLVGSLALTAVFLLLTYRGLRLALRTSRPFYSYLAAGITAVFTVQALLIMGGVSKLLPLTGVTLPFISYGGSSMLISSSMLGLLLFISSRSEAAQ